MSSSQPFLREARFGYDLASPLQQAYERFTFSSALLQDDFVVASTTEVQRAVQSYDGTTRVPTSGDFPTFVQTANTLTLLNEGDNTAFDETYESHVRLDAIVDAILFNFAIGQNVSAYTSDNFAIDSVTITMRSFKAPNQVAWSTILTASSTLANMTAVDNQFLIVNLAYNSPFPLYAGGMLEIQIAVNETTGTGTRQVGMLTAFPYQAAATTKELSPSGFMMYYHNLLSQANSLTTGGYAQFVNGGQAQAQAQQFQPLGYVVPVQRKALGGLNG